MNKATVLISLIISMVANSMGNPTPSEWTIITVDSVEMSRIFNLEKITPIKLSNEEGYNTLRLINRDFTSIKLRLNLKTSRTIDEYKFQLVSGINEKNDKLIFVQCIGKKLPQWIQSKWKSKLIYLKCAREELITIKINLSTDTIYEVAQSNCE